MKWLMLMIDDEQQDGPSKSQVKRDMRKLQALGESLVKLKPEQVLQFDLSARLRNAIIDAHRINSHGAMKRQLQFIGKLMRDVDPLSVQAQLEKMQSHGVQATQELHAIEVWRERLVAEGSKSVLTEFVDQYSDVDVQTLRHAVRNAVNEREKGKPVGASRALFRFLKESINASQHDS